MEAQTSFLYQCLRESVFILTPLPVVGGGPVLRWKNPSQDAVDANRKDLYPIVLDEPLSAKIDWVGSGFLSLIFEQPQQTAKAAAAKAHDDRPSLSKRETPVQMAGPEILHPVPETLNL